MKRVKGGLELVDGVYQPQWKRCSNCGMIRPIRMYHRQGKLFRRNKCSVCRSRVGSKNEAVRSLFRNEGV